MNRTGKQTPPPNAIPLAERTPLSCGVCGHPLQEDGQCILFHCPRSFWMCVNPICPEFERRRDHST